MTPIIFESSQWNLSQYGMTAGWTWAQTGDCSIVLYPEKNMTSFQIEETSHLLGQRLRPNIIALELDAGVLAVPEEFQYLGLGH
jgi:hypothetical protein